ncbi:unnamed protein product [Alopecurus aequalis]
MNPPPASERRDSAAPDASKERGAPASGPSTASTTPKEAPVTDSTENIDAQRGLPDTAGSNLENNNDIAISTQEDSPGKSGCHLETHLDDSLVHSTSKQALNSDGTRKRNFQPGNKEVHGSTSGSSRQISVERTKDAKSKFLKKSDNEQPLCEDGKYVGLAGVSEELKETETRTSLNSSCLKDEKEQKNGSRGKDDNNCICSSSTPHDLALPTGNSNSCLTKIVSENSKEAPECMGLKVNQNPKEVTSTNSFVVVDAKSTEGETVNADSIIKKRYDEVLPSLFEEKETENVATFLGSCMLDSNQPVSSNVPLMPLQGVTVNANVKTGCLDSTTGEYFYPREIFAKPSNVVSRHHSSEEHQNLGSVKHMREAIPHTPLNSAVKENVLPSQRQKSQSYPFNEGTNFFPMGMSYPNLRAGAHHSTDICGSGPLAEYGFGRRYLDHASTERNKMQEKELACLQTYHHNINHTSPSYPFSEGPNFFQAGMADPNLRAGVHHNMDIYGSGAMAEYGFGRSYFDHSRTERNRLQEKELACLSTYHNINRISPSPSSLPQAYSENLRVSFPRRHSLVGFRKKKLLILDLNGLLADINEDFHNAHMAEAKVRRKLVFRRPYCDDFLNFCIRNFELGIWSSRKRKNVDSVVDILMRDLKPYLLFSWDRSKCTITGRNTLENIHKPIVLKELRKLWNKEEPGLPWEEGEFSPYNTLLVDDSPYKALRNPPYSAIFPHPFSYLNLNDNSLGPGGDLRVYLEHLVFADDVESFVRNHPFGQPFITPRDPHWNFYAEIAGEGYGSVACRA